MPEEKEKKINKYLSMVECVSCGHPNYIFSNDEISPLKAHCEYEYILFIQCFMCGDWISIKIKV